MKITYINEQQLKIKYFKIESGLVKRMLDFYTDEQYNNKQEGSDK
jgi:hypothetical protein